jgi:hypothetical protein
VVEEVQEVGEAGVDGADIQRSTACHSLRHPGIPPMGCSAHSHHQVDTIHLIIRIPRITSSTPSTAMSRGATRTIRALEAARACTSRSRIRGWAWAGTGDQVSEGWARSEQEVQEWGRGARREEQQRATCR